MHWHNKQYKVNGFDDCPKIAISTAAAISWLAVATVAAGTAAYSAQNTATKAAKTASDIQQGSAKAASDMLVAREAKANEELKQAAATSEAQAKGTITAKKRAMARSETIYTSPLGIGGQADVARKMLLGQ